MVTRKRNTKSGTDTAGGRPLPSSDERNEERNEAMKKISTENTYKVRFKDEENRKYAWIHIQCMLVKIQDQTRPGRAEITIEERMKSIHDTAGRAYQLMTLYNEILYLGWAYGGFLAACYGYDKEFFKYIDYEPMTEEEIEERWDEKPAFDENPVHCTTYVINQELHDYFQRNKRIKEVETPPDFLSDETRQQYINSIEEAKRRQHKRWANIMRYIEGGGSNVRMFPLRFPICDLGQRF